MKIHLMGTGGAEGSPGLFSNSRVSNFARKHHGKDVRTRAAALIDDHIKIDFGPDTLAQCIRDNLQPLGWDAIFFTHSDEDHFCVQELQYAFHPFTEAEFAPFTVYGNSTVIAAIQRRYPDWPLDLSVTSSFCPTQFRDYLVTPIHANHDLSQDCHNFIFQKGNLAFLYASDTGIWEEDTWSFLSDFSIDALVIECNDGFHPTGYLGHLSAESCLSVITRLRENAILRPKATVVTTHQSCRGEALQHELEDFFTPHEIIVGYDGLSFNI